MTGDMTYRDLVIRWVPEADGWWVYDAHTDMRVAKFDSLLDAEQFVILDTTEAEVGALSGASRPVDGES